MDIGTTANVSLPLHRTTSAIGDGDVGQKGSYYRRQRRGKKPAAPSEPPSTTRSTHEESKHTIDIRV